MYGLQCEQIQCTQMRSCMLIAEPRMIMFCGRRILCHQNFRFYLSTPLPKPKFDPDIASTTCLLNFGVSHDTLIEDLLMRAFARIRPELYRERVIALRNLQLMKDTLYRLSETVKDRVLAGGQEAMISSPKALQFITDLTEAKMKVGTSSIGLWSGYVYGAICTYPFPFFLSFLSILHVYCVRRKKRPGHSLNKSKGVLIRI